MMKAEKHTLRIVALTEQYKIEANLHIYQDSRLSDVINADTNKRDFIPLTDAKIYNLSGELLYNLDFLNLNKKKIVLIFIDREKSKEAQKMLPQARAMINEHRYDDAIKEARKALDLDPKCAEAYYILGLAFCKQNKRQEGLKSFESALKFATADDNLYQMVQEMINQIRT